MQIEFKFTIICDIYMCIYIYIYIYIYVGVSVYVFAFSLCLNSYEVQHINVA